MFKEIIDELVLKLGDNFEGYTSPIVVCTSILGVKEFLLTSPIKASFEEVYEYSRFYTTRARFKNSEIFDTPQLNGKDITFILVGYSSVKGIDYKLCVELK